MKNIIVLITIVFATGALADPITIITDNPESSEIRVVNTHPEGQAELRARNDTGCHVDVWVSGRAQSDLSNWLPNEAGMVAESPCRALHLRANGDGDIRLSRGTSGGGQPVERMVIEAGRVAIHSESHVNGLSFQNQILVVENAAGAGWMLTDSDGNVYIGSQTEDPFHLTAAGSAIVTVTDNGGAEIWPSASCPDSIAPSHGGAVFCSDMNGAAWVITPSGATRIAP